jgi:hypothetical protein
MDSTAPSDYRLSGPFAVRMLGIAMALGGCLVLVAAALVVLLSWPAAVLSVVLVVAVVGLLVAGLALTRRATVVRFDETGYNVRFVRGAGVRSGRWMDVEDVVATTLEGTRCVVLRRRDGRTTTIPVDILAAPADDFVRDLQRHLNRGHGYRPVA